ncbi:MAG TPA: hypothetical protein VL651_13745 [Bacteroidia bacterium]|jgi:hypothetical protein|nr:hypothetical protein [Bacteroidia bacterium]
MTRNEFKKVIVSKIAHTEDDEVLNVVYKVLDSASEVHMLSAKEKNMISEARAEYQKGETISHEELQKELSKWLKR